jgi:hypothetical protein
MSFLLPELVARMLSDQQVHVTKGLKHQILCDCGGAGPRGYPAPPFQSPIYAASSES